MVTHIQKIQDAGIQLDKKVLFLTFDDGPQLLSQDARYTTPAGADPSPLDPMLIAANVKTSEALRMTLNHFNVPATFFLIGWRVEVAINDPSVKINWPQLITTISAKNSVIHSVANHTYHHPPDYGAARSHYPKFLGSAPDYEGRFLADLSTDQIKKTVQRWEYTLKRTGATYHKYFRAPHESGMSEHINSKTGIAQGKDNPHMINALNELNYGYLAGAKVVGNDTDPTHVSYKAFHDNFYQNIQAQQNNLNGCIFLMHDTNYTVRILFDFLEEYTKSYQFSTLSSYLP